MLYIYIYILLNYNLLRFGGAVCRVVRCRRVLIPFKVVRGMYSAVDKSNQLNEGWGGNILRAHATSLQLVAEHAFCY